MDDPKPIKMTIERGNEEKVCERLDNIASSTVSHSHIKFLCEIDTMVIAQLINEKGC